MLTDFPTEMAYWTISSLVGASACILALGAMERSATHSRPLYVAVWACLIAFAITGGASFALFLVSKLNEP